MRRLVAAFLLASTCRGVNRAVNHIRHINISTSRDEQKAVTSHRTPKYALACITLKQVVSMTIQEYFPLTCHMQQKMILSVSVKDINLTKASSFKGRLYCSLQYLAIPSFSIQASSLGYNLISDAVHQHYNKPWFFTPKINLK